MEAVDVACGIGELLRRDVTRRPDERRGLRLVNEESRIGKDWLPADIEHVSRLDVAMQEVVALQCGESARKSDAKPHALLERQRLLSLDHAGKRLRTITG